MWNALKRLLTVNPMGVFIYGLLTKWYIMVLLSAVVVTYWVFKGLETAGVLTKAEQVITRALNESRSVAKNCIPKINDLKAFWNCLENPPEYAPETSTGEEELKKSLEKFTKDQKIDSSPYE